MYRCKSIEGSTPSLSASYRIKDGYNNNFNYGSIESGSNPRSESEARKRKVRTI